MIGSGMPQRHRLYRRNDSKGKTRVDVHDREAYGSLTGMNGIEPSVIHRAVTGDRDAFAIIVEARWGALVAMARSVIGDLEAEDAVQDGLVLAWRRITSLREEAALVPWLSRVVLRSCLRRARRRITLVPLTLVAHHADRPRDPVAGLDVERCLAKLAPPAAGGDASDLRYPGPRTQPAHDQHRYPVGRELLPGTLRRRLLQHLEPRHRRWARPPRPLGVVSSFAPYQPAGLQRRNRQL